MWDEESLVCLLVGLTLQPGWKILETQSETCRLQKTAANRWWKKILNSNQKGKRSEPLKLIHPWVAEGGIKNFFIKLLNHVEDPIFLCPNTLGCTKKGLIFKKNLTDEKRKKKLETLVEFRMS